jgi:hypothetical protein
VPVLNAAAVTTALDEGGLTALTDTHGSGNDSGALISAAGSLQGLVSFGADGPAATPFHLVDAATAGAWLASLGLTSHGFAIDAASISGATLTALNSNNDQVFTLTLNRAARSRRQRHGRECRHHRPVRPGAGGGPRRQHRHARA